MEHAPLVHVGVPLTVLQGVVQLLQCSSSVFRSVSQPLPTLLSQSPQPTPHAMPHTPLLQLAVPLTALQAVPQALQLEALVLRLTSQPLAALLSQSPKPEAHVMVHEPLLHAGVPLAVLQGVRQLLQWVASVLRLTSQPLAALLSQLP
jgi:hypothetical protein